MDITTPINDFLTGKPIKSYNRSDFNTENEFKVYSLIQDASVINHQLKRLEFGTAPYCNNRQDLIVRTRIRLMNIQGEILRVIKSIIGTTKKIDVDGINKIILGEHPIREKYIGREKPFYLIDEPVSPAVPRSMEDEIDFIDDLKQLEGFFVFGQKRAQ